MDKPEFGSVIGFLGPAYAGKARAIERLYDSFPPEERLAPPFAVKPNSGGEAMVLWVDLKPPWLPAIKGRRLVFRALTIPGIDYKGSARKEVTQSADAFVFIVDLRPERADATIEAADNLIFTLKETGRALERLPLALQCHLPGGAWDEAHEEALHILSRDLPFPKGGVPIIPADPETGTGCDLAFKDVAMREYQRIDGLVRSGALELP
jgi:hypothetical protein